MCSANGLGAAYLCYIAVPAGHMNEEVAIAWLGISDISKVSTLCSTCSLQYRKKKYG